MKSQTFTRQKADAENCLPNWGHTNNGELQPQILENLSGEPLPVVSL